MLSAQEKQLLYGKCYKTNNNFAYKYDTNGDCDSEIKIFNFVPTYDPWCLNCSNKASKYRCNRCKSVFFCSEKCQKETWLVHKKHCGKNIFACCIVCCKPTDITHKCSECPVRFCSNSCRDKLYSTHCEFDCKHFNKTFGKFYLEYKT